jgi:hypothetical protein
MFDAILTGAIAGALTALIVSASIFSVFSLVKRWIFRKFHEVITQPDEKTPSPFAQFVDTVAFLASQRLVLQLKETVRGMNSTDARNEAREAANSIVSTSEALAGAVALIPGLRRVLKNPAAAALAARMVGNLGGNTKRPAGAPESKSEGFPLT